MIPTMNMTRMIAHLTIGPMRRRGSMTSFISTKMKLVMRNLQSSHRWMCGKWIGRTIGLMPRL